VPSPITAPEGITARLPTKARLPTRVGSMVIVPRSKRGTPSDTQSAMKLSSPMSSKSGDVEAGRGNLGIPAQFGPQQPVPGIEVQRGIHRPQEVEAHIQQLVDEPLAEVKEALQRIAARLHPTQEQPFHGHDFQLQQHDERQRRRKGGQVIEAGIPAAGAVQEHQPGKIASR